MREVYCHCGSIASLRSNSLLYNGKEYGNGRAFICDCFPDCKGSVGTHPDGRPLGTIPDEATKVLRRQIHAEIDPLWKNREDRSKKRNRSSVYGWLRRILKISPQKCHIGMFNEQDCLRALEIIKNKPYIITKGGEDK